MGDTEVKINNKSAALPRLLEQARKEADRIMIEDKKRK